MNILELLTDLGIEETIAKKAEKAINKEIPLSFVPKEQYSKIVMERDEAKKETKEIRNELNTAETYKNRVVSLEEEYKNYKTTVENEKITNARRTLAESKLADAGANPKAIKFLVKEIELDKLKDDGSNWDELHKPIMESNIDFYSKIETKGADVADPPAQKETTKNTDNIMNRFIRMEKIN